MASAEEFIWFEVVFALVVALVLFFIFYQNFSSIFPVGCDSNNGGLLYNQFTQARYGYPNKLEGTPLFRCYLTNACYDQATANQTCITNWCYYLNYVNGVGNQQAVQSCIANPPAKVLQNCAVISPSNTAALMSCSQSTIVADNSTNIEDCNLNVPTCIQGDAPWCPPCVGQ
ncbi:MAG: hypothetical protein M1433_02895 [Candidatus Parvarchaeota archaeon]|nr:hypothetical protein [Candidatus Parvarchaeota archaeon]